jgi:alpha-beta hydrolase superfamily lysophospholipase
MNNTSYEFDGVAGRIHVSEWAGAGPPRFITLLAHGYGEHAGRYEHVAAMLVGLGAVVFAPDHLGHGRSAGEPALVEDIEVLVTDLHTVADQARADHPGLPLVLVGHSMGGLIAARFAQRYLDELTALVLSGPVVGGNPAFEMLLAMDPLPEIPIDPAILSRDPAVGEAYAADPLVYHGPFHKSTLRALASSVEVVAAGGTLGDLPTLWIHGAEDQLVPYEVAAPAMEQIRGSALRHTVYEGAAHEVFNETNRDEVQAEVAAFLREVLDLD